MIIKKFDILSPPITLYYSRFLGHKSIISGVFTIIEYIGLIIVTLYYLTTLVLRETQNFFYYKQKLNDQRNFQLTNENLFHYLTFQDSFIFDPKAVTVFGAEINLEEALELESKDSFQHWKYQQCNFSVIPEENKRLINKSESGLCISEYYDNVTRKVYNINQKGFTYPKIQSGISYDDSIPYAIFFKRCQNTSENLCYEDRIIEEKIEELRTVSLNFIEQYIDLYNYETPFFNVKGSFKTTLEKGSVRLSNLYFIPETIKTYTGLIFDSVKLINGYTFEQVTEDAYEKEKSEIISLFFIWGRNEVEFYERKYLKLIDIIVVVNGIFKITTAGFILLNFLINKYILLNNFGEYLEKRYIKKEIKESSGSRKDIIKIKSRFSNQPRQSIKMPTIIRNAVYQKPKLSFSKVVQYYFKIGSNYYITKIMTLRKKIVSEERLIKLYLMQKQFKKSFRVGQKGKLSNMTVQGESIEVLNENNTCTNELLKNGSSGILPLCN